MDQPAAEKMLVERWLEASVSAAFRFLDPALAQRLHANSGHKAEAVIYGPEYSDLDVARLAEKFNAPNKKFENFSELCSEVSDLLSDGQVEVGWFQGRAEWGLELLENRNNFR